jgi:Tol biopolymer transport system component
MALELRSPGAAPRVFISGEGDQEDARFSPDGKWLVYTSSESGRPESYLVPFPLDRGPARQQVSFDGSGGAEWGPDGKSLFFGWSRRTYRVRVDPASGVIGRPEPLNRVPAHRALDMAPDGRFLMARRSAGQVARAVKVLVNWTSILSK